MAETQREPVPRVDSSELDTALAFLTFARHCVLKKADGLSDDQLRRVLVDSGTSVLGLVQHLAEAERYWFGYHLAGHTWDADWDLGMAVPADRAAADVLQNYRTAIDDSDRAIRSVGDPEGRFAVPVDGNRHTLRWAMAHMTSETARHAGHADILREQLDGTTVADLCACDENTTRPHKLALSVFPHNDAAIALYRKFGFVEEGRLRSASR